MKKSILLYLVILFVLTNIFTYVFLNSQVKFEQKNYDNLSKKFTDTILTLNNKLDDANYFSLEKNQNAQDYYENKSENTYIASDKIIPFVKEQLMEFNTNSNGNKFTDQNPIDGKKFIINKVKIINHRWLIADYNNGEMWGEVLIKYFLNDDKSVDFETIQSVIYSKQ